MHMLTQQIIDADPDEGDPETACIQTCSIQTRQSTFTPVSLIKPSFGLRIIIFWSIVFVCLYFFPDIWCIVRCTYRYFDRICKILWRMPIINALLPYTFLLVQSTFKKYLKIVFDYLNERVYIIIYKYTKFFKWDKMYSGKS